MTLKITGALRCLQDAPDSTLAGRATAVRWRELPRRVLGACDFQRPPKATEIFDGTWGEVENHQPSGKHTKSYWKWPFIVDFPIKNGDFP